MNNTEALHAILRKSTRKGDNQSLKREGYILGNITGKGLDSIAIAVRKEEFNKAFKKAGRNSVFTLTIEDQTYTTMIKEIQIEPLKYLVEHLDFQIVSLSVKMKQEVSIKIIGSAMLEIKKLLINSYVDSILVEGLPQNIPDEIVIDVSDLEADQSIEFKDIKLPEGITSDMAADLKLVTVVNSKIHETDEAVAETPVEA